ncbi:MAG: hypothetical protein ACI92G_004770 [Candidatus Pelagisphaera sp.]
MGFWKNPKQLIPNDNGKPVGRGDLKIDPKMWPTRHVVN